MKDKVYYKAGFWCEVPDWCTGESFWRFPPQWGKFDTKTDAAEYALRCFSPQRKITVIKVTEKVVRCD